MHSYFKLCTEFYDIDKPQAPPATLAFLRREAAATSGPILEPMSGSGRYLVPLLEAGFDIEGLDASPQMLGACRARCEARGLSATIHQQYLHELELPRQYGLVFMTDGSFSLLTEPEEARRSLKRLRGALLPGGKLVIEVERAHDQPSSRWPWSADRSVTRADGARIYLSWSGRYDAERRTSFSIGRYELVKEGRVIETELEDFNLRFYSAEEFESLLREAGFSHVKRIESYDDGVALEGSLLFEAR